MMFALTTGLLAGVMILSMTLAIKTAHIPRAASTWALVHTLATEALIVVCSLQYITKAAL